MKKRSGSNLNDLQSPMKVGFLENIKLVSGAGGKDKTPKDKIGGGTQKTTLNMSQILSVSENQ